MHRRAGIEIELESGVDQSVLRWFGHKERLNKYSMAHRVLMVEVGGGMDIGLTEVRLDGCCEGGLGQQSDDSWGCVMMRERY